MDETLAKLNKIITQLDLLYITETAKLFQLEPEFINKVLNLEENLSDITIQKIDLLYAVLNQYGDRLKGVLIADDEFIEFFNDPNNNNLITLRSKLNKLISR